MMVTTPPQVLVTGEAAALEVWREPLAAAMALAGVEPLTEGAHAEVLTVRWTPGDPHGELSLVLQHGQSEPTVFFALTQPDEASAILAQATGRLWPNAEANTGGGVLRVDTDPPGAIVFAQGRELGPAPVRVEGMPPGPCTITAVTASSLAQQRVEVLDAGEQEVRLVLQAQSHVDVVISSEPAGARVRNGEEEVGTTPVTWLAPPHEGLAFELELEAYRARSIKLDTTLITRERRGRLPLVHHVELAPLPVAMELTGLPPNARVLVDGAVVVGELSELLPGVHELQAVAPGYEPAFKTIRLHPGRGARFAFELKPTDEYTQYIETERLYKRAFIGTGLAGTVLGAGAGVAFFFAAEEAEATRSAHARYQAATGTQAQIDAAYEQVHVHRANAELAQGIGIGLGAAAAVALGFTMYFRLALPDDPSAGVEVRFSPSRVSMGWSF